MNISFHNIVDRIELLLFYKVIKPINKRFKKRRLKFLNNVSGLIHVGANTGQERERYDKFDLDVLWVEPIPAVFEQLQKNIKTYKRQQAIQALITDVDRKEYKFNIANNNGASSSIYALKEHKQMFPHVDYESSIMLKSITLNSLFKRQSLNISEYQALIMDTQGSELLVLEGSLPLLKHFKYIKTEVANFESYKDCCTLSQITAFMKKHGYREYSRVAFARSANGKKYYDIVFEKR